jgi:hypothetical protein
MTERLPSPSHRTKSGIPDPAQLDQHALTIDQRFLFQRVLVGLDLVRDARLARQAITDLASGAWAKSRTNRGLGLIKILDVFSGEQLFFIRHSSG